MELFEQEYQLAQQLRDSRLLRATDYFHYGASPVLAFPYCSHGSALHYLQRHGPLPEEELARLIYQIGGALAYLHSRRPPVLHLDLKPDNILLSSSGDYMLADFGVSVRLQSSLLRGSNMKGATLDYLAPEHWTSGKLGAKADIFSLGVTLWELTTGRSPFPGQGGQFLLLGLPVPDIPTEDGYTKRLNRLVHRCLSADPEDRPSARDLETWADSFLEDGYWPGALSSGGGEGASPQPAAAEDPGGQPTTRVTPGQEAGPQPEQEATAAGQAPPGAEAGQATYKLGPDQGDGVEKAPQREEVAMDEERWVLPFLLVLGFMVLCLIIGIYLIKQG
jgi:serine/threonine protein kinase